MLDRIKRENLRVIDHPGLNWTDEVEDYRQEVNDHRRRIMSRQPKPNDIRPAPRPATEEIQQPQAAPTPRVDPMNSRAPKKVSDAVKAIARDVDVPVIS